MVRGKRGVETALCKPPGRSEAAHRSRAGLAPPTGSLHTQADPLLSLSRLLDLELLEGRGCVLLIFVSQAPSSAWHVEGTQKMSDKWNKGNK